jgi:hypothetical protein
MGNCTYCGQNAGFLKSKHKECEVNHHEGKQKILNAIARTITEKSDFDSLENDIKAISESSYVKHDEVSNLYIDGFDKAVNLMLEDGLISPSEEERINNYSNHYDFAQETLNKGGSIQKVMKALILRDITEGKTSESRLKIEGNLPFMLQKSEVVIWAFENVDYYEQQTRTQFQGRSQGVSIRIAKGLYYRTGVFKGNPVKISEMKYLGAGLVALTNKNIYFSSSAKSFKVPYNKILTLDPYEDGIGLQKDGTSSKPQVFKGLDGWFTYNLISNLNQF